VEVVELKVQIHKLDYLEDLVVVDLLMRVQVVLGLLIKDILVVVHLQQNIVLLVVVALEVLDLMEVLMDPVQAVMV
jgi:hypothetical protein